MLKKVCKLREDDRARMEALLVEVADEAGLSEAELYCVADITCGTILFEPLAIRFMHGGVEDAELSYFQKWEVDRDELIAKLSRLDHLGRVAVAFRCRSLFAE